MKNVRPMIYIGLVVATAALSASNARRASGAEAMPASVQSFLKTHCVRCHGGDKVRGKVDLARLIDAGPTRGQQLSTWELVADRVTEQAMPPESETQPTDRERAGFADWYRAEFLFAAAKPGNFRVRRLSAVEYRRTVETLFGFPLRLAAAASEQTRLESSLVMKLMPPDPKGASGYTNNTAGSPITRVLWENYSYVADVALAKLFGAEGRAALESHVGPIAGDGIDPAQADRLMERFHARAWRRPVSEEARAPHRRALQSKSGTALVEALKKELKLILMSPEFVYRGFLVTPRPGEVAEVDAFELAERLSYFLWADMPDEELSAATRFGMLADPGVLRAQVDRMLRSPRSRSLAEVFGVQWLLIDEIDNLTRELPYAAALKGQPIEFLNDLIVNDRPLRELLDSRTEFVNLYLIGYYKPDSAQLSRTARRPGVERERLPLERIELKQTPGRGGLLTMPGVLMMNSGAIQRGAWVLQRILGEPLGEPPPDVPPVRPARAGQDLTFRQRFEEHRSNKTCATCHDRIDPLGFAFEAYNPRGGFLLAPDADRQQVRNVGTGGGSQPVDVARIDTSGTLPTGERFDDLDGLKAMLTGSQWPRVVRNIVRQTLAYGLCRSLEPTDEPVVKELTARLARPGATWGELIHAVTESVLFRQAAFPPQDASVQTSNP